MQTASTILMIEPVLFGYNAETAKNNYFQKKDDVQATEVQQQALEEFNNMAKTLRSRGVEVIVVKDTETPHTPDSIFPNNWVSFHGCGNVVMYPMYASNRRLERRKDILENLEKSGFEIKNIIDFSNYECEEKFLEGTGSMILDRDNHIAYAALSQRTDKDLFELFCRELLYTPVSFSAYQLVENQRLKIYHTNVMMCVADKYVVICLDCIDNQDERAMMVETIEKSGKIIVEITEEQMHQFAGNMLQISNADGEKFLVMSQSAYLSLSQEQISTIEKFNPIISVPIPTIEKYGGGSARCMMAEIFLPKGK